MRCFVAIPVSARLRAAVVRLQDELRRAGADVRWEKEENFHLTLKYLGEMDEGQVRAIRAELLDEAGRRAPFTLEYAGMGAFLDQGLPRVVWIGGSDDVRDLAAAVELHAEAAGVPREGRPYTAHLTIGRVRSGRNAEALLAAIEERKSVPIGTDRVESIVLMRSTLNPAGSIYEEVARFPLRSG